MTKYGYLNDVYDKKLEQIQLEYVDLLEKSMSEFSIADWKRYTDYEKKSSDIIKLILKERKVEENLSFRKQNDKTKKENKKYSKRK